VNAIYSNSIGGPAPRGNEHQLSAAQQVIAHLGGMLCALRRHRPLNWEFHWRGICRAISPRLDSLERGNENSVASPVAMNTSTT